MVNYSSITFSPYSKEELFDLVLDIERYPEFLPWCSAARILKRERDYITAELVISFKAFREKYISLVKIYEEDNYKEIDVSLIEGPFRHLYNRWRFVDFTGEKEREAGEPKEIVQGTEIHFNIEFIFKSFFLEKLIGAMFEKAAKKMTNAFERRAENLYKRS